MKRNKGLDNNQKASWYLSLRDREERTTKQSSLGIVTIILALQPKRLLIFLIVFSAIGFLSIFSTQSFAQFNPGVQFSSPTLSNVPMIAAPIPGIDPSQFPGARDGCPCQEVPNPNYSGPPVTVGATTQTAPGGGILLPGQWNGQSQGTITIGTGGQIIAANGLAAGTVIGGNPAVVIPPTATVTITTPNGSFGPVLGEYPSSSEAAQALQQAQQAMSAAHLKLAQLQAAAPYGIMQSVAIQEAQQTADAADQAFAKAQSDYYAATANPPLTTIQIPPSSSTSAPPPASQPTAPKTSTTTVPTIASLTVGAPVTTTPQVAPTPPKSAGTASLNTQTAAVASVYTVAGHIKDSKTGKGLANVKIMVYDDTFNQQTFHLTTDANGAYSTNSLRSGDAYAVRIDQNAPPSGYQWPPKTTAQGWTWNYCTNPHPGTQPWGDTPVGSGSYECQTAGTGTDCGSNGGQGAPHCDFAFDPVPQKVQVGGHVKSNQADTAISGVEVDVFDATAGTVLKTTTDANGAFSMGITDGTSYAVRIPANPPGYNWPPKTTNTTSSKRVGGPNDGTNTPLNDPSYEWQKIGNSDCAMACDFAFDPTATISPTPTPSLIQVTCLPRPACLDATPRCELAEPAQGWCPPSTTPSPTPPAGCTYHTMCVDNPSSCITQLVCTSPTPIPTTSPTPTPTTAPNCSSATGRPDLCECGLGEPQILNPHQCASSCVANIPPGANGVDFAPGTCCPSGQQFCTFTGQCTSNPSSCTATGTVLTISALLPGIGKNLGDNKNPQHIARTGQITIFDAQNHQVAQGSGQLIFDGTQYTGLVPLNTTLNPGSYSVNVKFDNTLSKRFGGILNIATASANVVGVTALTPGDVDGDNVLDIRDYNDFISCFSEDSSCTAQQAGLADFNDDGKIDEIDLNILQRGFAIRSGDDLTPITITGQTCQQDSDCPVNLSCFVLNGSTKTCNPEGMGNDVLTPTPNSQSVSVSSITPNSGPVGTQVTITGTGFGSTNYINSNHNSTLGSFPSTDGKTITFTFPSDAGAICNQFTATTNPCPQFFVANTPSTYSLVVKSQNGTSNAVSFTLTSPNATPTPCTTIVDCAAPPSGCNYQGGNSCTCGSLVCPDVTSASSNSISMNIQDFSFSNSSLTASAPVTVTWTNTGQSVHTVTADDGSFDSGDIQPGQSYSHTFTTARTFHYHCIHHSQMTGTITVQ